ncbi:Proteasome inhibitor PI31 subunit-like protein [Dinothrombium tinctorium]|uniref:Proteasome inhibitor PI31 subunit n=1 Tax=Dinothrombium tinctorium TaxID=1965070 RepID=A0A3S3RTN5_9ACAR|nr:Proteasome inhibitor PI31 subunit-like protein [Dinothrombium tinctorium]
MHSLELLFKVYGSQLKCKDDVIVLFAHCFLVNNGYRCLGTGSETQNENETGSEVLPANWNQNEGTYCIRYKNMSQSSNKLILTVARRGEFVKINMKRIAGEGEAGEEIKLGEFISDNFKDYNKAFVNNSSIERLQQILQKITSRLDLPQRASSSRNLTATTIASATQTDISQTGVVQGRRAGRANNSLRRIGVTLSPQIINPRMTRPFGFSLREFDTTIDRNDDLINIFNEFDGSEFGPPPEIDLTLQPNGNANINMASELRRMLEISHRLEELQTRLEESIRRLEELVRRLEGFHRLLMLGLNVGSLRRQNNFRRREPKSDGRGSPRS